MIKNNEMKREKVDHADFTRITVPAVVIMIVIDIMI